MRRALLLTLAALPSLMLATAALGQATGQPPAGTQAPRASSPPPGQPLAPGQVPGQVPGQSSGQVPGQPQTRSAAPGAPPQPATPTHHGLWQTEGGKSRVEVADCGPGICATIVWLREPTDARGRPLHDANNKVAQLRSRPILGLPLFETMRPTRSGWIGRVYDPEEGDAYDDVSVWLSAPDRLSLKGCVLFVCQTHHWTRVASGPPAPASTAGVPTGGPARR
jgi:uncharacterized protein (DUF2147 family)